MVADITVHRQLPARGSHHGPFSRLTRASRHGPRGCTDEMRAASMAPQSQRAKWTSVVWGGAGVRRVQPRGEPSKPRRRAPGHHSLSVLGHARPQKRAHTHRPESPAAIPVDIRQRCLSPTGARLPSRIACETWSESPRLRHPRSGTIRTPKPARASHDAHANPPGRPPGCSILCLLPHCSRLPRPCTLHRAC